MSSHNLTNFLDKNTHIPTPAPTINNAEDFFTSQIGIIIIILFICVFICVLIGCVHLCRYLKKIYEKYRQPPYITVRDPFEFDLKLQIPNQD